MQAIRQYISSVKKENPLKNRGLNSELCLEDQLLLTLYCIRRYLIFLLLGQVFNISESYANKIYHKISNILIKIAHVKGVKSVAEGNVKDIVIDQRPKKGQKDYYSGKKTAYNENTIDC